ncbi:MAG: hypothetical protein HQ500_11075 [Flavobacteriales bacterium]|nr:hypothetical protein [Flavobacteriales bacterium]
MRLAFIGTLLLLCLAGCQETESKDPVIAKVGDNYLSYAELKASIPNDLTAEDSTELATNLIQTWINRELMFSQAQYNLQGIETDIEDRVEKYRKELYIFAYEKEQVNQKLDTVITEEEIIAFYDENQEIFQLNDYILKVRYVKLALNSPNQLEVQTWIQSEEAEDLEALTEYCHKYAVKYFNDTNWVYFNELLRELPIEVYNKESFLRSDNLVEFTDPEHIYFLSIRDLQSKNTLSPLELEHERINSLILNKRKLELLSSIRSKLYKTAVSKGNVTSYEKPQIPN